MSGHNMRIEDVMLMHDGHDLPELLAAEMPQYDMQTEGNEGEACAAPAGYTFEQIEIAEKQIYESRQNKLSSLNVELQHLRDDESDEPDFAAKEQAIYRRLNALFCG